MSGIKNKDESPEIFNLVSEAEKEKKEKCNNRRNLAAFWLFGLCNNLSYVIMLSAAYDILEPKPGPNGPNATTPAPEHNGTTMPGDIMLEDVMASNRTPLIAHCNPAGTGVILLADILPCLFIKMLAPFFMQKIPYSIRVLITIIFSAAAFIIVALSKVIWFSIVGVVCASISTGFGEITFLSLASHFSANTISTWSSGTGGAGVGGALLYAGLTNIGLSPRNTVLLMLIFTVTLGFAYFWLLIHPKTITQKLEKKNTDADINAEVDSDDSSPLITDEKEAQVRCEHTLKEKLVLILPLLQYMIPLGLVYTFEYFINQTLYELLYFPNTFLVQREQYRWYQVIYQIGVLISRSSVNCFHTEKIWIFPIFQGITLIVLLCQVLYQFMPSIWIVFCIILLEGLFGGAGYVNTFYTIIRKVKVEEREYSMGVASVSDSCGIVIAALSSVPVHNFLCSLYK
ncbi:unnamed protein product [Owenia fusiformis]|uniref:Battenin n=1 Tax=Owenia fusiformis TaxID=6347 RepID=A0A8J1YBD9_OWEFU|nr:unnamed protein product [Owenia fusiformis]